MVEMNTNQVVKLLLIKEAEITNKFHNSIEELLRLGYDSIRGKEEILDLIESAKYSLDEIERMLQR